MNSSVLEERGAADPYFAGLNEHFQSAIVLIERLGRAWEQYSLHQGHPHRCAHRSC